MAKSKQLTTLGEEAASLPTVPQFSPAIVVADVRAKNEQAANALAAANRANIEDAATARTATDFIKSVTATLNANDEARRRHVDPHNALVKVVNQLYKGPEVTLTQAKNIVSGKLLAWNRAEQARKDAEAAAERERIQREAAKQATQAVEEGDIAGAKQILAEAERVPTDAGAVTTRGNFATSGTTKRKVGKITDLRKFLGWVATSASGSARAVLPGITVGQRELNQLAATVLAINADSQTDRAEIPGFEAEEVEGLSVR